MKVRSALYVFSLCSGSALKGFSEYIPFREKHTEESDILVKCIPFEIVVQVPQGLQAKGNQCKW